MVWTNKLIFEFLNVYRKEPTIWNTTGPEHKHHTDAYDAWRRIKNQLDDGTIPITELKRKRDNLMATYRKQRTKVMDSMGAGSEADEVYKPAWPFYRVMSAFLDNIYAPRKRKNSEDSRDTEDNREVTSIDDYEIEKDSTTEKTKSPPNETSNKSILHESKDVKKCLDEWDAEDITGDTSVDDYEIKKEFTAENPKPSSKKISSNRTLHKSNDLKKRFDEWDTDDLAEVSSADDYEIECDPLTIVKIPKTLPKQTPKKRKLNATNEAKKRVDAMYDCFKMLAQKPEPDTCSLYCDLLCNKLRSLNESTRDIAMMKIDRLMYNLKQQDNQTSNGLSYYSAPCPKTE